MNEKDSTVYYIGNSHKPVIKRLLDRLHKPSLDESLELQNHDRMAKELKTQDEIVDKIIYMQQPSGDFFGVKTGDLLAYLDYEHAKEFLKPEATQEEWEEDYHKLTKKLVLQAMEEYLPFAFGKANGKRGISASRSLDHYEVWTWLLGDEEIDFDNYEFYGKDILVDIAKKYGFSYETLDDGVRENE